jgi:S-adenosylmethionine:tRNA ribosyltransferase-isomerase
VLGGGRGVYTLRFSFEGDFDEVLLSRGCLPLPPYIRREAGEEDRCGYQTVYASRKGAVAAPTAGLHFSDALLERIRDRGVAVAPVTLHVGYGTFLPVRVNDIREHRMHAEPYQVSEATAEAVAGARRRGGKVVAVGTTCVRTLETAADGNGGIRAGAGTCDLFIYPGYRFRSVDAMITNFHLPKSTLMMLVSAFAGWDFIRRAYREAVEQGYRFFSYGDAMMIR